MEDITPQRIAALTHAALNAKDFRRDLQYNRVPAGTVERYRDDIEQECAVAILECRDKAPTGATWATYAVGAAKRAAIRCINRELANMRRDYSVDVYDLAETKEASEDDIPPSALIAAEDVARGRASLASLPLRSARLMQLRYRDGMTQAEAAKAMRLSRSEAQRIEAAAIEAIRDEVGAKAVRGESRCGVAGAKPPHTPHPIRSKHGSH